MTAAHCTQYNHEYFTRSILHDLLYSLHTKIKFILEKWYVLYIYIIIYLNIYIILGAKTITILERESIFSD